MILTLDSSMMCASVALIDDGKIIYSSFLNDGRTHSQKLMPMVCECFNATGYSAQDINAFAAIAGPGSFTGLRIGIAAIQGIAYTSKKPCIAINSLDALANNITCFKGVIVPLIDARNAQAYSAIYDGLNLNKISDDMAKPVKDIAEQVKDMNTDAIFLGCGANVNKDIIIDILGDNAFFAPEHLNFQNAKTAALIAQKKYDNNQTINPRQLVPYYLREVSAKKRS